MGREKEISPRIFVQRDSLITNLLKERSALSVYCILFVILFFHTVVVLIGYALDAKKKDADASALASAFPNFEYSLACWLVLHAVLIVIVYPLTRLYVASGFKAGLSYSLLMFISAMALVILPLLTVYYFETKYLATGFLLVDQLRLLMKMIDFVSVNKAKNPNRKKNDEMDTEMRSAASAKRNNDQEPYLQDEVIPTFSKFMYFLAAPTHLYRDREDNYYAKGKRKIMSIIVMVIELSMLLLLLFKFTLFVSSSFSSIGIQPHTVPYIANEFFMCCLLALLYFVTIHYVELHSLQNFVSNVLKFGDRKFYSDYWSSVDPGLKARNYDSVTADWLDKHVYNPIVRISGVKALASLAVMLVVGIAVEYLISMTNGFFIPLAFNMLLAFLPAMVMKKSIKKMTDKSPKLYAVVLVMQHMLLLLFLGLMALVFAAEHYSRVNCSRQQEGVIDLLIPRSISCITLTGLKDGTSLKKALSYLFTVV